MALNVYNKKRDFKKTPEPKGRVARSKTKNLYIIQKHAASHLHYDFRLELQGVLLSWAVPKGPCLDPSIKRLAMQTEDHPIEYGSFEGIIPKGEYGGGTVMLWDSGIWITEDEDPAQAYRKGHLRFTLEAKKLKGRWSLIRFKSDEKNSWFLIKAKDKYAKPLAEYDITIEKPNSVLTNLSIDEITDNYQKTWTQKGEVPRAKKIKPAKKKLNFKIDLPISKFPSYITPQLATLVDAPPVGDRWIHEIKFDGYRMLAFIRDGQVKLISRNGKDWTHRFANIIETLKLLKFKNCILDGEIVLLDKDSKSNFQMLQNSLDENKQFPFIYYIFDILYYDQYNLMEYPLLKRKEILKNILSHDKTATIRFSDHIVGSGKEIFDKACKMGLEGIISKDLNCPYVEKRSKNWLKIKCLKRQEFVIGGYTKPEGSRSYFGSLYIGYYEKDQLIYCGNVGTGFTEDSLHKLYKLLQANQSKTNPFASKPPGYTQAIWIKPNLVCEVEFTEWTKDGILRHPSFKGLRSDKKPTDIVKETEKHIDNSSQTEKNRLKFKKTKSTSSLASRLTNPNKILYPEDKITKLDLANYYDSISEWILPYITNRPLTLVRCPENYNECFYQKHINQSTANNLYGIKIKEKDKIEDCIYIKDYDGLIDLVQMGTLEIHPWGSSIPDFEYPNMITFDLDPAPEIKWKKLVEAAFLIKNYLQEYPLQSFVKTTGGKGLHIVVPILPELKWAQVKNFCHTFVKYLVSSYPEQFIGEMSKQKRKNKIFLDYLRNQRGATSVSAYSTRARKHAPVSTPLDWDELTNNKKDNTFTIMDVPQRMVRLKQDPWKKFFKLKQSLKK